MNIIKKLAGASAAAMIATSVQAQFLPDFIQQSDIRVQLEYVGTMPAETGSGLVFGTSGQNIQSPVSTQSKMYFIDHFDAIYSANRNGQQLRKIFSIADGDAPEGLAFQKPLTVYLPVPEEEGGMPVPTPFPITYQQRQAVFNVAPSAVDPTKLYVVLVAVGGLDDNGEPVSTLPDVPRFRLPEPVSGSCCSFAPFGGMGFIEDLYDIKPEETQAFPIPFAYPGIEHQILYEFTERGHALVNPRPIAIFDSQGGPLHHGAALLPLEDGRLLYWTGDAVPFGLSGLEAPQDPSSHLSKILLIDPATGSVQVAASGVRNVQYVEVVKQRGMKENWIAFHDIGGWTAEEINTVRLADLLDTSEIENFGWGVRRDEDGIRRAREGTLYVAADEAEGALAFSFFSPLSIGQAPVPEPGFIQPHAQYTRPQNGDALGGVAATGPVTSTQFRQLTMLFSDLDSGRLYGTTDPIDSTAATVFLVTPVDEDGTERESLRDFSGGRADPRFFRFPDGSPGVLLEGTGDYYRLKELR